MKTCSIEGCDRKHLANGLCSRCYQRTRHTPLAVFRLEQETERQRVCSVAPCTSPVGAKGKKGCCPKHYRQTWVGANPQKLDEYRRRHFGKTRSDQKVLAARRAKKSDMSDAARAAESKKYNLARYGLTPISFKAMWDKQRGLCAICQVEMSPVARTARSVCVDHLHGPRPWKARALLCRGCNTGLGNFYENPEVMEAAAEYVRAHSRK